ncbi:hypothetical protein LQW54_004987 [Pestalotiopsis sp. IQ-011]
MHPNENIGPEKAPQTEDNAIKPWPKDAEISYFDAAPAQAAGPASRLKKTTSGRVTKPGPAPGQKKSDRDAAVEKTGKTN